MARQSVSPTPRPRLRLLWLFILPFLALMALGMLSGFLMEWLWFSSEGYGHVFWARLSHRWFSGATVGMIPALGVLISGLIALRGPRGRGELEGLVLNPSPGVVWRVSFRSLAVIASIAVFLLYSIWVSRHWADLSLWRGEHEFPHHDPLFKNNAAFYALAIPALHRLHGALWVAVIAGAIAALAIYTARGWAQVILPPPSERGGAPRLQIAPAARPHLAALAALGMILLAAQFQLSRYALLYHQRPGGAGPNYTDANAIAPLLLVQALAALAGAGLVFTGVWKGRVRPVVSALIMLGIGAVALGVYPGFLRKFKVEANELKLERPYLAHLIDGTRQAFKLDKVEERMMEGGEALTTADIDANRGVIENIRLWDDQPLLETFSQIQEIWTSYEFVSVDSDRYMIDGRLRQTMISPRELDQDSLVNPTWVNRNMTYTHGHGLALGPVNEVTAAGLPDLWVRDLPPQSERPNLKIDFPQIYFGEKTDAHVFVNTAREEFDYPAGSQNVLHTYQGDGGMPVGGFFRRLLFAMRFGDMKVLLTGDFTSKSRALIHREVSDRLGRVAPFVMWDKDPYMVIHEGRLVWMADGYTASDKYPYAWSPGWGINYLRNSVKATVDAYTGRMDFYIADTDDPIILTWSDLFPGLFKPLSAMPEGLRAHLRVPALFFNIQAGVYATYHMSDPQAFYNQEDKWEIPKLPGGGRAASGEEKPMEPYYLVTRLPDEPAEEFILMLPFTPISKSNLTAWLATRNDGEHYGQLVLYRFPRERLVYGPRQIRARIDQDERISPQLTLWGQQGSEVLRGAPLAIPIENTVIYAQPIYLRAENGRIPEFKRVVVAYENQLAMEPTLEAALRRVIAPAEPQPEAVGAAPREPAAEAQEPAGRGAEAEPKDEDLIQRAKGHYDRAIQMQREGDWAGYGREIEALGQALERLSAVRTDDGLTTEGR